VSLKIPATRFQLVSISVFQHLPRVTVITDPFCTCYETPGHPERPSRIRDSVALLKSQTDLPITWAAPLTAPESVIQRAHSASHLKRLLHPEDFDADTAYHNDIGEHARASVGAALAALNCAHAGEPNFSLMRPPGHHAMTMQAMGFCYLNSIAIAALEAQARTGKRVAIFDFDVHHGNGTEDILMNRPDVAFYSIHQCALDDMLAFKPEIIGVSAGFDAYARDPIAEETLEAEDFQWLGQQLRGTGLPLFNVLEGGYSDDLPQLILAYLKGITG
jgi:acetoin utilization deacetylase AcuC-like enzyme